MQSQNDLTGTTLKSPLFWLKNTFQNHKYYRVPCPSMWFEVPACFTLFRPKVWHSGAFDTSELINSWRNHDMIWKCTQGPDA